MVFLIIAGFAILALGIVPVTIWALPCISARIADDQPCSGPERMSCAAEGRKKCAVLIALPLAVLLCFWWAVYGSIDFFRATAVVYTATSVIAVVLVLRKPYLWRPTVVAHSFWLLLYLATGVSLRVARHSGALDDEFSGWMWVLIFGVYMLLILPMFLTIWLIGVEKREFQTRSGVASSVHHATQLSRVPALTTYTCRFDLNGRGTTVRASLPLSLSDGDTVIAAGIDKRKGFHAYAIHNLTTGIGSFCSILPDAIAGVGPLVVGLYFFGTAYRSLGNYIFIAYLCLFSLSFYYSREAFRIKRAKEKLSEFR